MKNIFLVFLTASVLSGCATANLQSIEKPDAADQSTIIIYRDFELNAGGAVAIFGANDRDWLEVGTNTWADIKVKPGSVDFFVRAVLKKESHVLKMNISTSSQVCLRIVPNSANIAAALVPVAGLFTGSTFF